MRRIPMRAWAASFITRAISVSAWVFSGAAWRHLARTGRRLPHQDLLRCVVLHSIVDVPPSNDGSLVINCIAVGVTGIASATYPDQVGQGNGKPERHLVALGPIQLDPFHSPRALPIGADARHLTRAGRRGPFKTGNDDP
jgi:hypothetical protein